MTTLKIEACAIDPKAPEYGKGWICIDTVKEEYRGDAKRLALESMAEYMQDDYIRGTNGWYAYRITG